MQDLLADFYARGGQISKIETGKTTLNMTNAEWRRQTRLTKAERMMRDDDAFDAEQAAERRHEQVREAALYGGSRAAIEALNDF